MSVEVSYTIKFFIKREHLTLDQLIQECLSNSTFLDILLKLKEESPHSIEVSIEDIKITSATGTIIYPTDYSKTMKDIVQKFGTVFYILLKEIINISPDPYDAKGDELYAIYRKGLISRHICKNGRVYQRILLENIEEIPENREIEIEHSSGSVFKYKIGIDYDLRYAIDSIKDVNEIKPYLWVPVIGPIKRPGLTNDYYYVLGGDGDNALYYGGMALASLMLEHNYKVSLYSILYARSIVKYFLLSEMNDKNGRIIRRDKEFNCGHNVMGENYMRSASQEEFLGLLVGLMYYLRFEDLEYQDQPLYKNAEELRNRVLKTMTKLPKTHGFWLSSKTEAEGSESYTDMFQLYYAYFASVYEDPVNSGPLLPHDKQNFKTHLKAIITLQKDNVVGYEFWEHIIICMSMILVFDGSLQKEEKEELAKWYMKRICKRSLLELDDRENLKKNCFWGVIAIWCAKFLDDADLNDIWGDDINEYINLAELTRKTIIKANFDGNEFKWQRNLPLLTRNESKSYDTYWKNHNEDKRIGNWCVWLRRKGDYFWAKDKDYYWKGPIPGWNKGQEWHDPGPNVNEREYMDESSKKYHLQGYLDEELVNYRGRNDIQSEGVGLGLIFPRMLLTQIDSEEYPPPKLPLNQDLLIKQKYYGTEPLISKVFHCRWAKNGYYNCGKFEIGGNKDKALRVIPLGENKVLSINANKSKELSLNLWSVEDDDPFIYPKITLLWSKSWLKFNQAEADLTTDNNGNNIIVIAERGKKSTKYFLRMSLWRLEGDSLTRFAERSWAKHYKEARWIDMRMLNRDIIAVVYKNHNDYNLLKLFKIDYSINMIKELNKVNVGEAVKNKEESIHVTTAFGNVIITSEKTANGNLKIYSRRYSESEGFVLESTSSFIGEEILDIATTTNEDLSWLLVAYRNSKDDSKDYLILMSYQIFNDGKLVYRGLLRGLDGGELLFGRQTGYERLSIEPVDFKDRAGFVICAKAFAFDIRQVYSNKTLQRGIKNKDKKIKKEEEKKEPDEEKIKELKEEKKALEDEFNEKKNKYKGYEQSEKGLKILYGYIWDDGRPTIEGVNVVGSGKKYGDVEMCDITSRVNCSQSSGVVTVHKDEEDCFQLVYWEFKEEEDIIPDHQN